MPASVLRLIQLGDENTWGTDTAATVRIMGVTDRTIRRDWVKARAWLFRELKEPPPEDGVIPERIVS